MIEFNGQENKNTQHHCHLLSPCPSTLASHHIIIFTSMCHADMTSCRSWDPQHNPPSTIHSCNIKNTEQIIATDLELPFMRSFLASCDWSTGKFMNWPHSIQTQIFQPQPPEIWSDETLATISSPQRPTRQASYYIIYIILEINIQYYFSTPWKRPLSTWSFPASSQQGMRGCVALCDGLACLESWSCEWPMEVLKVREMFSHVLSWSKQFYFSIKWCLSGGQ